MAGPKQKIAKVWILDLGLSIKQNGVVTLTQILTCASRSILMLIYFLINSEF
jgi:hypothetical protein